MLTACKYQPENEWRKLRNLQEGQANKSKCDHLWPASTFGITSVLSLPSTNGPVCPSCSWPPAVTMTTSCCAGECGVVDALRASSNCDRSIRVSSTPMPATHHQNYLFNFNWILFKFNFTIINYFLFIKLWQIRVRYSDTWHTSS